MTVLFVYNADSGVFTGLADTVHKLASPETYQCNLCRLTHPIASMDREWKKFTESLPYPTIFLHRDEFAKRYPEQKETPLPAVFGEDASGIRLLLSSGEINEAKDIPELIALTSRALSAQEGSIIYRCSACGLGYKEEEIAKKCHAWCVEHASCNLDITSHAVSESEAA